MRCSASCRLGYTASTGSNLTNGDSSSYGNGSIPATRFCTVCALGGAQAGACHLGELCGQRLVTSLRSLHALGQHLGAHDHLVLEAVGAQSAGVAAREATAVEHRHG